MPQIGLPSISGPAGQALGKLGITRPVITGSLISVPCVPYIKRHFLCVCHEIKKGQEVLVYIAKYTCVPCSIMVEHLKLRLIT